MMSKRPAHVNLGDRVRVTIAHTGVITELNDDEFAIEPHPGRPVRGSFYGDGEFVSWEVLPSLPPEPPDAEPAELPWRTVDPDGDKIEVRNAAIGITLGVTMGDGTDAAVRLDAVQSRELVRAVRTALATQAGGS